MAIAAHGIAQVSLAIMMDIHFPLDSAAAINNSSYGSYMDSAYAAMNSLSLSDSMGSGSIPSSPEARQTLWMGDLDPWMDENFIKQVWYGMGEQVNVKLIRDKFTGCVHSIMLID
jgi:hypothetical protein